ncbi:4-hydroxy-tetrahydrodipicolinate reductase [Flavilitoribacter nigricans]|uniref:4-hydroxy-tetrahydrodipicolinate reductase n=1 Tax=Flavilitoribacter nigricans (strain ATCC 23147 / DSM 23189 / NBRC 102662 / NCIMB 1420 / SS-2) TaxID=1122177 RepID=A0A2D0NBI9_FLAN2|nr:4-hydroxy-tetrahydrodipicolinate reductase [Flavilitoribacter nigricans DSM 23189 = NBRC 102662]
MKIALLGYGKMGKTIDQLATADGHEIVLKIDKDNVADRTPENLKKADVAIEFSQPDSAFDNICACLESGVPVVAGTTAWLDRLDEAKALVEQHQGALFYASNFSIGVNIFFALNRQLAKMMNAHPDYTVDMEEIHHTQKLDAPSGTAITLAEGLLDNLEQKSGWVEGKEPQAGEIPITSKREGMVPGTHIVNYHSSVDTITIKHEAHSREGFAKGALSAATWIVGKQGFFGMSDLLGY